jgi:asparagine synthase (glutamine-hydrolysing)
VDIGRELLPAGLDDQPKRGFAMPMDSWLRQELSDRLDEALSPATVASRGLLDPQAVTDIREDFTAGRRTWTGPWLLMVLELWCREMIDAGGSQSS